jgi:Alr-MurF fusion protein
VLGRSKSAKRGTVILTMKFTTLTSITRGQQVAFAKERPVSVLLNDSRKPVIHEGSVFFAIKGDRHDGHEHIAALYAAGVRQFIVEKNYSWTNFPEANALQVSSSVEALQQIVAHHRQQFSIPVIGITGSNGKTIIKEWLFQLLSPEFNVIKNPGSYNSQIGVPLSVWQMQPHHQLGIFEAGLSMVCEMDKLQGVMQPTLGVFTNLGTAHDENFKQPADKIKEKLKLFKGVDKLLYCSDQKIVHDHIRASGLPALCWGSGQADIRVSLHQKAYRVAWKNLDVSLEFPFTDAASVENALHCVAVMLSMGYTASVIQERVRHLRSIPMRLELKEGIHHCHLIDDTYNNDLGGLRISLDFLNHQHQKRRRTLILSDILQSGLPDEALVKAIADQVNNCNLSKFIGIGPALMAHRQYFTQPAEFYTSTDDFLKRTDLAAFNEEIILVKGARAFRFERIVKLLQKKVHGTVMEINLGALVHNLNVIKSRLNSGTKLMVMVKAFAYGSGSIEIANLLQFHQVDYLGVAYTDEGIELRQNNITIPIMVMNPSAEGFPSMLTYNLEPEIYSLKILRELVEFLGNTPFSIHLKLDTGMHRLGFEQEDLDELITTLKNHPDIKVISIFSHLAGADEREHDEFSRQQAQLFLKQASKISSALSNKPLLHLLNTPGIMRLPEFQLDMVRLGIGLYGVDPTAPGSTLKPATTLKTVISQIRHVKKGETIGYGRKGSAREAMKVATIAIGYADGYSRAFSRGVGEVLVNRTRAKVVGNVCMDMTMIDITGIEAEEGDEVIIFGAELPLQEIASKINTIPYEILTNTSERVKRIFVAEGI